MSRWSRRSRTRSRRGRARRGASGNASRNAGGHLQPNGEEPHRSALRVAIDVRITDAPAMDRTGLGRYACEIVRAVHERRPHWDLLPLTNRPDVLPPVLRPAHVRTRWPTAHATGRAAWHQLAAAASARRLRPDVWFGPTFVLPRGWWGTSVVTIQDLVFMLRPDTYQSRLRARYATATVLSSARRAAVVICPSQETAEALTRAGIDRSKVEVIRHGVSAAFRHDPSGVREAGDPYALFVGTVEPRKGVSVLLEAVHRLNASGRRLRLVIAGRLGWGVKELKRIVEREPWVEVVHDPPDEKLAALYRGALAAVYPSQIEGFGLPVGEAICCGCPVVATRLPAIVEYARDVPLYVPVGDPDAIADRLRTVIEWSPADRDARTRRGIELGTLLRWDTAGELTARAIERAAAPG